MKKIIRIFIGIMIILFIGILLIDKNNLNYINKIKKEIISNTEIISIKYINKYDDYYIVMDDENVYVFSNKYYKILELGINLIHENTKNYDMIYRNDTLMYFNNYIKKKENVYNYYDIYTYELIDSISFGG